MRPVAPRRFWIKGPCALASLVATDGPALVVFNPTSWPRTDMLQVSLPEGMGIAEPDVPCCTLPQGMFVLVRDVPPCGYRVLKLARKAAPAAAQPAEGHVIESRFYRVRFDPASGGIASIRDKEFDRELVDPKSPFHLNQYLHVAGYSQRLIIESQRAAAEPEDRARARRRCGGCRWAGPAR